MLGTFLLEPFSRLVFGLVHFSKEEIASTLKGYCMLWGAVTSILKKSFELCRYAQEQKLSLGWTETASTYFSMTNHENEQ